MTTPAIDGIILCQPDQGKGCSLCCGLFNFSDITPGYLSLFLQDGKDREAILATHDDFITPSPIRDEFAHICPYQGFLNRDKPGCLIHPLSSGTEGRGRSLFAEKICGSFFCPAHSILSEDEKKFLVKNIPHWHLYSIAIADPESYSFIYNYVKDNFSETADPWIFSFLVKEGLAQHAESLAEYKGIIFCYSIPEYNTHKINFSIRYINKKRDLVVSHIKKLALQ